MLEGIQRVGLAHEPDPLGDEPEKPDLSEVLQSTASELMKLSLAAAKGQVNAGAAATFLEKAAAKLREEIG